MQDLSEVFLIKKSKYIKFLNIFKLQYLDGSF